MPKQIRSVTLVAFCLSLWVAASLAQSTNSGDIRGTATDKDGSVVPRVTVTIHDVDKNVTRSVSTDGAGLFDTGPIVPDHYIITFAKQGFQTYQRGPITVAAGTTAVNGVLTVGTAAQRIVVTTDVPLLQTETGSQSTTLQSKALSELPQIGADWEHFIVLLPGASNVNYDPSLAASTASINGNLPYNAILTDGADTTLPGSENSDVAILETIQETQIITSSFSAQYGMGGTIFNQLTKGGTDRFHGAGYDYFQNSALDAAPYSFGQTTTVPILHYNNFGVGIGGPILPQRLFFFFDYDRTLDYGGSENGFITVPTAAMRSGDFTGAPTLYDPTTQTVDANGIVHRKSFSNEYGNGNKIPSQMIDPVAKAIQAYYPAPNTAGITVNGITNQNYFYNVASNNPFIKYFGRLDYNLGTYNHMVISETEADNPAVALNQGLCPINCEPEDGSHNDAQVSDVWTIRPNIINEARFGFVNSFTFWTPETLNGGYPEKLGWKFAKADIFPEINISNFYGLQPSSNAIGKSFVYDPSDLISLIIGRHVLHLGGELLMSQNNSAQWGNINGGDLSFTGVYTAATQGAANTSGLSYADFLLGKVNQWNAQVVPEYGSRIKAPQLFVQDDVKVHPNLTVNLGLRWQGITGFSEVKGNMVSFDPTVVNPVNNTPGAMWYGFSHANGRTRLQAPVWTTFLPRLGVSYQFGTKYVLRGGVGLFAYTWSQDMYGSGMGSAFGSHGNLNDNTNGVYPVVQLNSDGNTATQPDGLSINSSYLTAPSTPDAYNGQSAPYQQYHTPVPKILEWNLQLQRELGNNSVVDLSYVASHGSSLPFLVDINQVPADKLAPDDDSGSTNSRPYPLFQSLSGGGTYNAVSNYNSLQASLTRRLSSGLQFNANYTWSHMLDTMDSSGWGGSGGIETYQSAYDPSANYGSSNFDVRNAFKGYAVYDLPIGHGEPFLNSSRTLDEIIGGWQIAPTIVWTSGNPFTPVMANNTSYSQAGAQYPNQIGDPHSGRQTLSQWFNSSAYEAPVPGTFGDARRNSLYGPDYFDSNLALGKIFHMERGINVQIRGEATNVINHPSFGLPNSNLGPGEVNNITGVSVGGRTMQLYGRISF
jgi:hypothetical protein